MVIVIKVWNGDRKIRNNKENLKIPPFWLTRWRQTQTNREYHKTLRNFVFRYPFAKPTVTLKAGTRHCLVSFPQVKAWLDCWSYLKTSWPNTSWQWQCLNCCINTVSMAEAKNRRNEYFNICILVKHTVLTAAHCVIRWLSLLGITYEPYTSCEVTTVLC